MAVSHEDRFVSTEWLAERLGSPGIVVVDGSWYLPAMNRDGRAEYAERHIPGAVFFDIDAVADTASGLPHMLPAPEAFAETVGAMGIGDEDTVVVYDGHGLFSAPRVWWTFRVMGAREVRILDGGLPRWLAEGRPVDAISPSREPASFAARLNATAVRDMATVRAALDAGTAQVVDARPSDRFAGSAPEPRPGVRSGHMPGSLNLPFPALVEDGRLKSADDIRRAAQEAGIDLQRPVITSCGSGVTAALAILALEIAGARSLALYDGAWAEWGADSNAPIVTSS